MKAAKEGMPKVCLFFLALGLELVRVFQKKHGAGAMRPASPVSRTKKKHHR
jgi:hypothetical protein